MRAAALLCAGSIIAGVVAAGCSGGVSTHYLSKYEAQAGAATRAFDAAKDDTARARALSDRGRAHSETARYSRFAKLAAGAEYERLYGIAMADHDRAVALAPADAAVRVARGLTMYDRAVQEDAAAPPRAALFEAAAAEFSRALETEPANAQALDARGLVALARHDLDAAIRDFTGLVPHDPRLGSLRLVNAYCERGRASLAAGKDEPALADFEQATTFAAQAAQDCDCQPEAALVSIYTRRGDYPKAWEAVHRAEGAHHAIDPEALSALKKASGRER